MIIDGLKFKFIDTIENPITIADSWVKPQNKIGNGNGEAKLYIGARKKMEEFFGGTSFDAQCFVLRDDLIAYMDSIKFEYLSPSQNYRGKDEMQQLWHERLEKINALPSLILFNVQEQDQLKGTRGYVNSNSSVYSLIREISLPLVTYISAMQLERSGKSFFYWKLFADFDEIAKRKAYIENYGRLIHNADNYQPLSVVSERPTSLYESKPAREGQEIYRRKLLQECPFCPITLINEESLLIASHIKPWAVSNNKERIDPNNGFVLSPLYDKLFDRGYITFKYNKRVVISNWLSKQVKERIGICENQLFQFLPMNTEREKYLEYHRRSVFKG